VATQATRVDAADICHLFERRWPGQVRGLSWLAPVATRIVELDALEDAGLVKAKTSAMLCAFIKSLDGTGTVAEGMEKLMPMEPGASIELPVGTDVSFTPTSDMQGLGDFTRHMQRTVASGVGLPYELLAGDLSQVNYSSAKLGLEAFKRRVKGIRASILVSGFLRPLWQRFVTLEVLSGRLNAPDFMRDPSPFFDVNFLFPEWAALDPLKEAQADTTLLAAGLRSRQELIAARGRDPQTVDEEIAADSFVPSNVTPIRPSTEAAA
jgi:lambda family phage portal protein